MPARVSVTAVLVAHDGSRYLPTALSALASSTVAPAHVVAADTGSTDGSIALLRRAVDTVVELPRTTSYADAVHAAVAAVPADTDWIWLLHDDSAPDPGTLAVLLRAAATSPAAVLGPKVVDWDDPRVLVEIGCTTDLLGVRGGFVEPGEPDQGQHEGTRPVLAVGTAGALVRRDVWDELGGLTAELPLREDLDLGWRAHAAGHEVLVVPSARLRHARAVVTGRRDLDSADGAPAAIDRRSTVHLLLAHASPARLLVLVPLLLVTGALRALRLLLVRRPREAAEELRALTPPSRELRRTRRTSVPRRLRASVLRRWRGAWTARLDRAVGAGRARPRQRPALAVLGVLALVTLLATRDLLGRGVLAGGRLLPAPEGAADLWQAYADTGVPALAALAVPATALAGSAQLAVDLLLLGSVPLSGLCAALVARRVVSSRVLQAWVGATWALLPVATGAVATGHLGAAAVHVALPALLLGGARVLGRDPTSAGWWRAWALGLGLTPLVALVPGLSLLAVLLLAGAGLLQVATATPAGRPAAWRQAGAGALAAGVPFGLLVPWFPDLLSGWSLLHGPWRTAPGLADAALPAGRLLLLQPGGPGTPLLLLTLPLLLAALGGLLRTRRARVAAAGWALALVGLAAALLTARLTSAGAAGWPGIPLDLAAAGMLLSALVGAEAMQRSLSRAAFGWRQLSAVLLVGAAAAVPLVLAADWVRRGADGPVQRVAAQPLPAYAAAELAARPGLRALLLEERSDDTVGYAVVDAGGPRLGDGPAALDEVVAALIGPPASVAAQDAAEAGIAFVAAGHGPLAQALDAQPGLDAEPAASLPLWRVTAAAMPQPQAGPRLGTPALVVQALAVGAVVVLAAPAAPARRGLRR